MGPRASALDVPPRLGRPSASHLTSLGPCTSSVEGGRGLAAQLGDELPALALWRQPRAQAAFTGPPERLHEHCLYDHVRVNSNT